MVIRPAAKIEEFINDIKKIEKTDVQLFSLLSAIITLIQTQPALNCLFKGEYIIEILAPFNKGYVDKSAGENIIQLVLAIL